VPRGALIDPEVEESIAKIARLAAFVLVALLVVLLGSAMPPCGAH